MAEVFNPPLPAGAGRASYWPIRQDSANSLALAAAARRAEGPLLVVCEDTEAAERLLRELRYYLSRHEDLPVLGFPDWETLPYENFSPHQDIVSQRLTTLHRLPLLQHGILVLPVTGLMLRLPPRTYVAANSLDLQVGRRLAIEEFREQLIAAGYTAVNTVLDHAEFAVRGSVVDLFPMGSPEPIRVDLFDEEIESLRSFDPETQRTRERIREIRLLPGREY
ncbi:MAG: transcription-repair coupling factor, partial [Gammaproteobacteria bacterium]|nr:transcription-repair coupling factor [Gammaproteobacteria bacterium]